MASTNSYDELVQLQLNKPKSNRFNGESRRLAMTSTNGLSHVTVDRKHLNASKAEGLACGIGLQRIKKPVKLTWRAEGANERHGGP